MVEKEQKEKNFLLAIQKEAEEGYTIELISGTDNEFEQVDLDVLGTQLSAYFMEYVYVTSGLSDEELAQAILPVTYQVSAFNEAEDNKMLVVIITATISIVLLYIMVLFFGM